MHIQNCQLSINTLVVVSVFLFLNIGPLGEYSSRFIKKKYSGCRKDIVYIGQLMADM